MKNLINKIFESAERSPGNIAISTRTEEWTYQDMLKCVKKKAEILENSLMGERSLIGIVTDETPECLMNIIAILYIGCGYVPIDRELPLDRMKYIIRDTGLQTMIVPSIFYDEFWLEVGCVLTEKNLVVDKTLTEELDNNPATRKETDVTYIMYTSGSTGEPKGVIIEDRNIEAFSIGINDIINFTEDNIRFLASTAFCFDISILETLIVLSYGATCILVNRRQKMNPIFVADLIKKKNVNILQFTPTYLLLYMKYNRKDKNMFGNVKQILIGGERFPEMAAKEIRDITDAKIYNCYGPTEATIWATVGLYDNTENTTIGRALNGYTVWLDTETEEICIGGKGVARGYLNKGEQSKVAFKYNEKGELFYRTGDFGKMTERGQIRFCGRKDRQVKVKGFRVELNEIEQAIESCTEIEKAAVILLEETIIVCCYQSPEMFSSDYFIRRLKTKLPTYMVPQQYIAVKQLPETINGKINYEEISSIVKNLLSL